MAVNKMICPEGRGEVLASCSPCLRLLLLVLTMLAVCTHSLPLPSRTGFTVGELALNNEKLNERPQILDELWLQPVLVRRLDTSLSEKTEPESNTPTRELLNVGKIVARLRRAMASHHIKGKATEPADPRAMSVDARNARTGWDRSGWGGGYGK